MYLYKIEEYEKGNIIRIEKGNRTRIQNIKESKSY